VRAEEEEAMRYRLALGIVAVGIVVLGPSAPALAQQATKSMEYKPVDSIQEIRLSVDKVRINQIVFKLAPQTGPGPGTRRSTTEAVVRIDNEGLLPVAVGVAVSVMDEAGNIVAAGSGGTRSGWLQPGERGAASIKFPYVYRNLARAKTFVVTMEVEPKTAGPAVPSGPAATGPGS
jgi:hypothetical protein